MSIDSRLIDDLVAATGDVFQTMVQQEVRSAGPIIGDALRPGANVVATVAFAGSTSGLVAFYSTLEVARRITAHVLAVEPAEVRDEIPDAIGELTNVIAGSFRKRSAELGGEAWGISVPTVVVGSDFYTKIVSDVERVLCPFLMGDAELFVELIVGRKRS
jgi:chemotaxis protein CheX